MTSRGVSGRASYGVSFHYIVASGETVDEVMGKAVAAGGDVVKEAAAAQWGGYFGYFGYFSDPDGYLWKVASPSSFPAPLGPHDAIQVTDQVT